jgi:flagellar L-ring protein precursor FlgH
MKRIARTSLLIAALAGALLSGCTVVTGVQPGQYPPALPSQDLSPVAKDGGLFQPATALTLFDDVTARRVGDTITVRLSESTQASKSAQTDANKTSSFDTGNPSLLGKTVTRNADPILSNSFETTQDFTGDGSSSQSNSLQGNITVTVAEIYPNGNLLVRGEKWLTLNQGEEYIQVAGIVRPADIAADNTIDSFMIADARITYSGNGTIANVNKPGIISKLLMRLWPL